MGYECLGGARLPGRGHTPKGAGKRQSVDFINSQRGAKLESKVGTDLYLWIGKISKSRTSKVQRGDQQVWRIPMTQGGGGTPPAEVVSLRALGGWR